MQTALTDRQTEPTYYLPEHDVYGLIHKGLRHALSDVLVRLGQVQPHDDAALHAVLVDLEQLLRVLTSHAHHEEQHLHRAIEARLQGGSQQLAGDHLNQEHEITALRMMMRTCEASRARARVASLRALYLSFATFAGENLVHMSTEEGYAQPLLEQLYSTAELQAIHGQLLQSVSPEDTVAAMQLMALGANHEERVVMFTRFQQGAPPAVFASFAQAVLPRLSEPARAALVKSLPALAGS